MVGWECTNSGKLPNKLNYRYPEKHTYSAYITATWCSISGRKLHLFSPSIALINHVDKTERCQWEDPSVPHTVIINFLTMHCTLRYIAERSNPWVGTICIQTPVSDHTLETMPNTQRLTQTCGRSGTLALPHLNHTAVSGRKTLETRARANNLEITGKCTSTSYYLPREQ